MLATSFRLTFPVCLRRRNYRRHDIVWAWGEEELHDLQAKMLAKTSTANTLLACVVAFDVARCIKFLAMLIVWPLLYACAVLWLVIAHHGGWSTSTHLRPISLRYWSVLEICSTRFSNLFDIWHDSLGRGGSASSKASTYKGQHRKTRTHIHASSAIRTHAPSIRAAKTDAKDRAATVIGATHNHNGPDILLLGWSQWNFQRPLESWMICVRGTTCDIRKGKALYRPGLDATGGKKGGDTPCTSLLPTSPHFSTRARGNQYCVRVRLMEAPAPSADSLCTG
jgi:hypothetical protein